MRKLHYLMIATAALGIAACAGGSKTGYVITGTVEGANDGDTVYLEGIEGVNLIKLDTAVIAQGKFTFEGKQDSVVNRYITCVVNDVPMSIDFFLESGKINVALTKNNDMVTGTPNNDIYQEVRGKLNKINKQMGDIYKSIGDSTLTNEQKVALNKESMKLEEEYGNVIKEGIRKNITNPVGISMFKQSYYNLDTETNDELLKHVPAQYQNDETIIGIKEFIEKQKITVVGRQFVDFEMNTPDGNKVKLSDYAGKGKVVLVDFWASWCGPCRREMPNLVETYAKYKAKNFEIVGVSLDQDGEAWKKAIKDLKLTWPQMSDLKFWECEAAQLYSVSAIPHIILIDGEGKIIARGLHGEELLKKIEEVVK